MTDLKENHPENIISVENGGVKHGDSAVLTKINISIRQGELVYLTGKVGSGKSSFLKMLYAELPLEYGKATVAGFEIKNIRHSSIPLLRRKCGIAFQDFKLLTDRNVYDNLSFVLRAIGWKSKKEIEQRVNEVLDLVSMKGSKEKMPYQLSGGEQKRVVIARTLLNRPPLIIADEPTANLDKDTAMGIMNIFKTIQLSGKTVIIATHQPELIEKFPGRVLICKDGTITDPKAEEEAIEPTLSF